MSIEAAVKTLLGGQRLSADDFALVFEHIISGAMADQDIADVLGALEAIGVSDRELHIGAKILRRKMLAVSAPKGAMDIVGTGGDSLSTYNISTACCFVVAGAGVFVAKHGNRAVSSKSGASQVLQELGVKLDIDVAQTEDCIRTAGAGFLFAPNHHKAMGNVAKARAILGTRSLFNCLGPLVNPANVEYILLGVFEDKLRDLYARALLALGAKRALIVHGMDGMDEITTTAPTMVSELKNGVITEYEITPEQYGLSRVDLSDIEGGTPAQNALALQGVLDGQKNAYRDIVLLNSGAALYAACKVESIADGIALARTSIDGGKANATLQALIEASNA
ncbi:MAG: anthranilate phosphoribosyltransferase [Robiginitomaculum sp.]|nr:MAG: anthranilate phosphoribosyltransferase [Robiginitomaculum sp.]